MDTDRLAEFRAAWREEVMRRNRAPESLPEPKDVAPVPDMADDTYELAQPHKQSFARSTDRQDTLCRLLEPLVAAHEAAAHAGATYTTYEDDGDLADEIANLELKDADHHGATDKTDASYQAIGASDDVSKATTEDERIAIQLPYRTVAQFHRADPEAPFYLDRLPEEVLLTILLHVVISSSSSSTSTSTSKHARAHNGPDYTSLELVARTCWRMRLLTAAQHIWNVIVRFTYMPPQTPAGLTLDAILTTHSRSWRNVFLFQPRVRLNGAYIASMRYLRTVPNPDNVWVNVIHNVDYFRLIRFYADGKCVMLLTTDPPADAVHKIGMHGAVGRWRLIPDEGRVHPSGAGMGAMVVLEGLRDVRLPRYSLHMTLYLEQTSAGRWNKLELIDYASRNDSTGDVQPFPHRHKRPFWFSRVRSYGT
ncbi:hypothetical protein MCUN1_002657 [Malassezia cuniculi]|uniref:F-box protein Hrt3/FBXO9 C-terminal domain-containing protein n=1 Tax=Malassezia cuniculi TaxID=948313 RepID=A0AAF0EW34_9BASI|nr:hypothetical protein MCUN1_002657 [Malassezia cuniculi]